MAQRLIVFDAKDALALLTHYNDGKNIPLDVELMSVGVSPYMQRWLGFECVSDEWMDGTPMPGGGLSPLQIRYEGRKIMTLTGAGAEPAWKDANEDPTRQ
jgi:hypothetical protein